MVPTSSAVLKIHDAAIRLFAERGGREVSISDLADAAGVARGTIYNNISNPDTLFDQVASNLLHALHVRASESMSNVEDPAMRMAIGIRLFIRHSHDEPWWGRFVVRFATNDDTLRTMMDEPPTADLKLGMQAGRFSIAPVLIPSVLSLIAGSSLAAMQSVLGGRQTWREAGEQAAELILRALGLPAEEAHAVATSELPALAPATPSMKRQRSS